MKNITYLTFHQIQIWKNNPYLAPGIKITVSYILITN